MKTIYKYPLDITDIQTVQLPADATILSVQLQNEVLCLWAMLDTDNIPELRYIVIIGTGYKIDDADAAKLRYIGTFQMPRLVFHVFEELKQT